MPTLCEDKRCFVLFIGNVLMVILGLVLLVLSCVVLSALDLLSSDILPLTEDIHVDSLNLADVIIDLSYVILVLGLLTAVTGSLGLVGVWWRDKCMLYVYGTLLLILFVTKLVVVSLWIFTKIKLEKDGKTALFSSLSGSFKDDTLTNTNSVSNAWNHLFMTLDCCGINEVTGKENDFSLTSWCTTSGDCKDGVKYIPLSCCNGVTVSAYSATHTCYLSLARGSYNTKDCYSVFLTSVNLYGDGFITVGVLVIVNEVVAMIFTIRVLIGMKKQEIL